jgi:hypothetical protein
MASAFDPRVARRLPELPADAWAAIARAALHAEDDDVRTWARLSLVNSSWRAALQGVLGSVSKRFTQSVAAPELYDCLSQYACILGAESG